MRDANDEIDKRGARVVVVGNGKPHHAKAGDHVAVATILAALDRVAA